MKSQVQVASTTTSQVRLLLPPPPHMGPLLRWDHLCVSPTVWNLSMESYVIHTNYKEYAVVMMRPLKASEEELTTVRLFCESGFSVVSSE